MLPRSGEQKTPWKHRQRVYRQAREPRLFFRSLHMAVGGREKNPGKRREQKLHPQDLVPSELRLTAWNFPEESQKFNLRFRQKFKDTDRPPASGAHLCERKAKHT